MNQFQTFNTANSTFSVDMARFAKQGSTPLYPFEVNGKAARESLNFNLGNTHADVIHFIFPDDAVVSESFVRGLLQNKVDDTGMTHGGSLVVFAGGNAPDALKTYISSPFENPYFENPYIQGVDGQSLEESDAAKPRTFFGWLLSLLNDADVSGNEIKSGHCST